MRRNFESPRALQMSLHEQNQLLREEIYHLKNALTDLRRSYQGQPKQIHSSSSYQVLRPLVSSLDQNDDQFSKTERSPQKQLQVLNLPLQKKTFYQSQISNMRKALREMKQLKRRLSASPSEVTSQDFSSSPIKYPPQSPDKNSVYSSNQEENMSNPFKRVRSSPPQTLSPVHEAPMTISNRILRSSEAKDQQLSMDYTITRGSLSSGTRRDQKRKFQRLESPGQFTTQKPKFKKWKDEIQKLKDENRKLKEQIQIQNPPRQKLALLRSLHRLGCKINKQKSNSAALSPTRRSSQQQVFPKKRKKVSGQMSKGFTKLKARKI